MEYKEGRTGRVFTIRFSDGDDPLEGIKKVAIEKEIRVAWFFLLGGLRQAGVVTGPEKPAIPPTPVWKEFTGDAKEIVGLGSILWNDREPLIHLHTAMGRGDETVVGCIRRDARTFLVIEALIMEIEGLDARRKFDEKSGMFSASFD
ncbi:MAG: DUF296 domain-containing protein [Thermodesulfobacteriota bacterium]